MKRMLYLDWLRVIATICVVIIHVSAGYVSTLKPNQEVLWLTANFLESISRWAVPGFVMISGVLLLSDTRELSIIEFLKKRTSKVLIPFLGWSTIFYAYGAYKGYFPISIRNYIKLILSNGITYHFWFFYMIIGLYLVTPLVKVYIENAKKQDIEYFLVLWLISSVLMKLFTFYYSIRIPVELNFVTGYVGYFILGYYLSQYNIDKKWRIGSYISLLLGMSLTFLLTYFNTMTNDYKLYDFWYEYFSPVTVLTSIGIFVLFKYNLGKYPLPSFLRSINKASLGIYILHYWFMNNYLWRVFPVVESKVPLFLVIPINVLITFVLSLVTTNLLQRIPVIKKLLP